MQHQINVLADCSDCSLQVEGVGEEAFLVTEPIFIKFMILLCVEKRVRVAEGLISTRV